MCYRSRSVLYRRQGTGQTLPATTRVERKKIKIDKLSRKAELYSTSHLAQAARNRGHEVRVIDTLRCYMDITSHHPEIYYKGQQLEGFDAIIPRIGASITFYGTAVVRQFEMMGVYCLNESEVISRSRNILRSLQLLARKGSGCR